MLKRFLAALAAAAALYCFWPDREAAATVTTASTSVSYSASGSTGTFSVPFSFASNTDLVVTDNSVTKVLTSDYTVSCAGCSAGGTVVFIVNPTAGHTIVISRLVPLTQLFDPRTQGKFDPSGYANAYDNLERQIQQLQTEITTTADGGSIISYAAPATVDGTTSVASAGTASTVARSDAKPATLYTSGGTGGTATTFAQHFGNALSLADFGGKCDGSTDDTSAITHAKTQAATTNAALLFRGTVNSGICKNTGTQGDIQAGTLMLPQTSAQLMIDRRIRPVMPAPGHPEYPLGNDLQFEAYGPADTYLRNRSINATATTNVTGGAGTTLVTVGAFTSEDCSTPVCDGSTGAKTGQINGTTAILSPASGPALNVIEIDPDTTNAEELGSSHWAIVDATHINIINPTNSHTQPFIVRQRGSVALTAHYFVLMSDGLSDHPVHVRDGVGTDYLLLPSDTTGSGTWPKKGIQFIGSLTGANGANSNLIVRNATAASCLKFQGTTSGDQIIMCEDASGNGTLYVEHGTVGIGNVPNTGIGLIIQPTGTLTGISQQGAQITPTTSSAATSSGRGLGVRADTTNAVYTQTTNEGILIQNPVKGAASTITNAYGLHINDITVGGTTNRAILTDGNAAVEIGGNLIVHGSASFGTASVDGNFSGYRATKAAPASGVIISQTKLSVASTLTADSVITPDVVGVGGGNFVVRLCSDGTTCGAGNIYLTCTMTCIATVGTPVACAVTKAAVAAATTLSWEVGTQCATTDPGVNVNAHYTTP